MQAAGVGAVVEAKVERCRVLQRPCGGLPCELCGSGTHPYPEHQRFADIPLVTSQNVHETGRRGQRLGDGRRRAQRIAPRRPVPFRSGASWLYFATRSDRQGAPVLICPAFVATARSAMKVSSVSPDRCGTDHAHALSRSQTDGVERLRQRTDLVHLDEDGVVHPHRCHAASGWCWSRRVIADQPDLVAKSIGQQLPACPVILVVLDVRGTSPRARRRSRPSARTKRLPTHVVRAVLVELGRRRPEQA